MEDANGSTHTEPSINYIIESFGTARSWATTTITIASGAIVLPATLISSGVLWGAGTYVFVAGLASVLILSYRLLDFSWYFDTMWSPRAGQYSLHLISSRNLRRSREYTRLKDQTVGHKARLFLFGRTVIISLVLIITSYYS